MNIPPPPPKERYSYSLVPIFVLAGGLNALAGVLLGILCLRKLHITWTFETIEIWRNICTLYWHGIIIEWDIKLNVIRRISNSVMMRLKI